MGLAVYSDIFALKPVPIFIGPPLFFLDCSLDFVERIAIVVDKQILSFHSCSGYDFSLFVELEGLLDH